MSEPKTIQDWQLHTWYKTRDGSMAWLAAIAIGPDGEAFGRFPLTFHIPDGGHSWSSIVSGSRFNDNDINGFDIIGPWVVDPKPLGRYCPVTNPPTEADGEMLIVGISEFVYNTTPRRRVNKYPSDYKWWCPLKPLLEMEVQR